jgi:hypothetical protein
MAKENFLSNKAIRVCLAHQLYITNVKLYIYIYIYSLYKIFFFYQSYTSGQMCQLLEIYSGKLLIICITKLLRSLSHNNNNYLFELQSIYIDDYKISHIKFI